VFDKYHVVSHVNGAVDQVRKYELRFGSSTSQTALRKSLWIWRKNPENLTEKEKQRLGEIEHKNLWTAKAYQMRLVFQDIYRSISAEEARRRFKVWCRWVRMVAAQAPRYYFAAMLGPPKWS
jgi:transposase